MNWTGLVTNTHTEVVRLNGGELAQLVETRCRQLGSLLRERRETLCSLEADHDQVGSVVPSGVEGASAVDGCTRSLGGMEALGALEVARIPSVNVPVCAVKGVRATPCMNETPSVSKKVCVTETPSPPGFLVRRVPEYGHPAGLNTKPAKGLRSFL